MMNEISENKLISLITAGYRRSTRQVNALHESDAELVQWELGKKALLAVTTDSIVEEIRTSLYDDPYLIGWMTVMVNLSDLAAVGAEPIGLLVSESLPADYPEISLRRLHQGISDACNVCDTYVLGGDTNFGDRLATTGCAIGRVTGGQVLTRKGCRPGDVLYASAAVGTGNAFALAHFAGFDKNAIPFMPAARLKEGNALRAVASCCMDTSDGVLSTLDQLMRLNGCGFRIDDAWELGFESHSLSSVKSIHLPSWLLLAGEHGEFELLFTIPSDREQEFLERAKRIGWNPLKFGVVIHEEKVVLPIDGQDIAIDTAWIRNLGHEAGSRVEDYIKELIRYDKNMRKGVPSHEAVCIV